MNAKQWALFFVVTLSVNYVSATFFPFRGGAYRNRRRSYSGYNTCNRRLYRYLNSNINGIRNTVRSRYGGRCNLGDRELDNYSLRNVRAYGFGNFRLGDTCQYYIRGGQAYVRFVISFEKIVASFYLTIQEDVGGILGELFSAIFGIIGYFVDKILQIIFPPFLCNIVVVGDYKNGFRLSEFEFLKVVGDLDFDGGLAGHGDILGSYSYLFFEPLRIAISLFLNVHIRPIFADGIEDFDYGRELFAKLGLNLDGRFGRGYNARSFGGGPYGGGIGEGSYGGGIGEGSYGGGIGGGSDDGESGGGTGGMTYGGGSDDGESGGGTGEMTYGGGSDDGESGGGAAGYKYGYSYKFGEDNNNE